jgi:TATA-binding protein-associated factor Taf7
LVGATQSEGDTLVRVASPEYDDGVEEDDEDGVEEDDAETKEAEEEPLLPAFGHTDVEQSSFEETVKVPAIFAEQEFPVQQLHVHD